jgi:hypothetical protein
MLDNEWSLLTLDNIVDKLEKIRMDLIGKGEIYQAIELEEIINSIKVIATNQAVIKSIENDNTTRGKNRW